MKIDINRKKLKDISNLNKNSKNIIFSILTIVLLILIYFLLNYNTILYAYNSSKEISENIENMKVVLGGEAVRHKTFSNRCASYGNR